MAPKLSVIIPVFDDRPSLERCLDSLRRQTRTEVPVEIVVVDNGSLESLEDLAEPDKNIRIIKEARPGSYAARNAGILAARGQILAFTDADCIPTPDWLAVGLSALSKTSGPVTVGGRVHMFVPEGASRTAAALYDLCLGLRQEKYWRECGFLITANLVVPSHVFRAVGLFREDIYSGGDVEWCHRASRAGVRLVYEPSMVVYHPVRTSWHGLRQKVVRVAQGAASGGYPVSARRRGGVFSRFRSRGAVTWEILTTTKLHGFKERAGVLLTGCKVLFWKIGARLRYRFAGERTR
jgi:glycosyltransferase involved in cell wall biosynthesis